MRHSCSHGVWHFFRLLCQSDYMDISDEVKAKLEQPPVGIRLDILRGIMDDLDANERLQGIFGSPVTGKMAVIADVNDLDIADAGFVDLTDEQQQTFRSELQAILKKRIVDPESL